MIATNRRYGRTKTWALGTVSPLRLTAAWVLIMVPALIAMVAFSPETAHAAPQMGSGTISANEDLASGGTTLLTGEDNTPTSSEQEERRTEVWSTLLTVGGESESGFGHLGYISAMDPTQGQLDNTTFTYIGVEYTIANLFEESVGLDFRHLVLEADARLPDDLVLDLDGHRFDLSNSALLGSHGTVHSWGIDASLGWEKDQIVEVKLLGPRISDPCLGEF